MVRERGRGYLPLTPIAYMSRHDGTGGTARGPFPTTTTGLVINENYCGGVPARISKKTYEARSA